MSLVQNKNTSNLRIAMIGSRNLEKVAAYSSQVEIYFDYCYQLAKAGVVMSSGLCTKGPDGLAQKAYAKAIDEGFVYFHDLRDLIFGGINCCLFDISRVLDGGFEMSNLHYSEPSSAEMIYQHSVSFCCF